MGIGFGAAYYHEYQPRERLTEDLNLMAAAGFTVIRVGESVWSTWEPADGVFDLDWLQPVLDGAHERGIRVILGTPTYAIPPWLQRAHPEIAARRADGTVIGWGARQEVNFTHPVFRRYAERVVRRIIPRYAGHPAMAGYQVDNEPGPHLLYNDEVFAGFVEYLKDRYGTVGELNRRWGLTYWSHRLSDWADLWRPAGNTTPSYDLAWRRYQATLTTDYVNWQADIVRELKRPDQFVTTCLAYNRSGVDDVPLTAALDIAAGNPYGAMQDELALPDPERRHDSTWIGQGTWRLYLAADQMRGSRQEPFLVTETGAASINGSHYNYPPYDGQLRQVAWALVSRGARMVEYWHWHTLHYGCETYWGGVLGHSLVPGRVYGEVRRIGEELAGAARHLEGLRPDSDVTFLASSESKWAMECQPPLATPGGFGPDRRSYERIFGAFYKGFFDIGCQASILNVAQLPEDAVALTASHPVLVVPALYITDDDTLDLLDGYARAGGHLLVTFRTGYADTEACARAEIAPGRLRTATGVRYEEYSNLRAPVRVTGLVSAQATEWVDGLIAEDAEPLAVYDHPHFRRWPAAATRAHGDGRVTYVGTLPDSAFAAALARFVAESAGRAAGRASGWVAAGGVGLPEPVRVTSARNAEGARLWFVHNWSWDPAELRTPADLTDATTDETLRAGQVFPLGSWDVRVFIERG